MVPSSRSASLLRLIALLAAVGIGVGAGSTPLRPPDPAAGRAAAQSVEPCPGGPFIFLPVTIPEQTVCHMDGWQVLSEVKIQPGATVTASGLLLAGTISADRPAALSLDQSELAGTLEVSGGDEVSITSTEIAGLVEVRDVDRITLSGSAVSGTVDLAGNSVVCEANAIFGVVNGCP